MTIRPCIILIVLLLAVFRADGGTTAAESARSPGFDAPPTNVAFAASAATDRFHWTGTLRDERPHDDNIWKDAYGAEVRFVRSWQSVWDLAATLGVGQWSANTGKIAPIPGTRVYEAGFRGSATVIAPGVALTRVFPLGAKTALFLEGALRYDLVVSSPDVEFDYVAHHGEQERVKSSLSLEDRPNWFVGAGVIYQVRPALAVFAEIGYQADLSQAETVWMEHRMPASLDATVLALGLRY